MYQFEGDRIAASSSRGRLSTRWIEFELYRIKESGRYVLSRVGMSLLYHHPDCTTVARNNLAESPVSELDEQPGPMIPCSNCRPDAEDFPLVCIEKPRHWAAVCETPQAVLDSLVKEDEGGSLYLTKVAERLLEQASQNDSGIDQAYRVETLT